jgi:hypothetical protein
LLRLITFLLLLYLLYLLLRRYGTGRSGQSPRRRNDSRRDEEELVLDPQCHSYVPKRDAISRGGNFFCSEECATLYLSR